MSSGIGYITGNGLSTYPFEDGEYTLPEAGTLNQTVRLQFWRKCFVDASIMIDATSIPDGGWPTLTYGEHAATNGIEFYLDVCGKRTLVRYMPTPRVTAPSYPVISGAEDWGWYTFTLSTAAMKAYTSDTALYDSMDPEHVDGNGIVVGSKATPMRLCARCITLKPAELTSIRVYDGVQSRESGPHFVLSGDVKILPGYNMQLTAPESSTGVELNAVAGAGLGVIPCECTKSERATSSIFSSDGHTRMFNDTCYDIEPYVSNGKGYLKIHEKCTACCTCDMYASIVNDRLADLARQIRKSKEDLDALLSEYELNVARFNERMNTQTIDDFTLSLSGMPVGSNVGSNLKNKNLKGYMLRCACSATLKNCSYKTAYAKIASIGGSSSKMLEVTASWEKEDGDLASWTGESMNDALGKGFFVKSGHSLAVTWISCAQELIHKTRPFDFSERISFIIKEGVEGKTNGKKIGTLTKKVEVSK